MPTEAKPSTSGRSKTKPTWRNRCDAIRHAPELCDQDARCSNRAVVIYRNRNGAPADFCTMHAKMADAGFITPARRCLSANDRQNIKRRGGPSRWAGEWKPKRM